MLCRLTDLWPIMTRMHIRGREVHPNRRKTICASHDLYGGCGSFGSDHRGDQPDHLSVSPPLEAEFGSRAWSSAMSMSWRVLPPRRTRWGPSGVGPSRVGDGADPTVIPDRANLNRGAADPYARKIVSIGLPLASSSTNLSR